MTLTSLDISRSAYTLATIWCALALGVTRPAPHSAPVPMWQLVEEVRFGDRDDEAASFGDIRGIAVTKTGNMFVLDFATRELRLFDARGHFLRVVARRGGGPGELEFPNGVVVSDDDQVIVSDPGQDRFSIYAADGRFLRQLRISIRGFGDFWHGTVDAAGRIIDFPVRVSVAGIDPRTQLGFNWSSQHRRLDVIAAGAPRLRLVCATRGSCVVAY